ncbi:MAG TPA: hypothetical protein VK658_24210 [Chryseolinea sp.]|nr:hypothetical protein [Chryseolinea sp.]
MFEEPKDLFHLYIKPPRNHKLGWKRALWFPFQWTLHLLRDFAGVGIRKPLVRPDFKGKKIVYANTYNNYLALKFLIDYYKDAILATDGGYVGKMRGAVNVRKYWQYYRRLDKYIFLLYLWIHPKYRVKHFDRIRSNYGFIDSFVDLLRGNEPVCIFISNDHVPASRALILACRKLNIPCFYIQHASVTDSFPPLRSSHALLYGDYSADIYRNIPGSLGEIIAIGNQRFDEFGKAISGRKRLGKIGVAYNTRDELARVKQLSDFLSANFGSENIIVRGHPADKRSFDAGYAISRASEQTSLEFLMDIDVLIAGNSSIILEAATMNVQPYQYYFWDVPDHFVDYYGFIRTGIAVESHSKEDLVAKVRANFEQPSATARSRTKLYDASIGTPYEFRVGEHIIDTVETILMRR